jgi:hemerythrin-like metal-binding protein
MSVIVWNPEFSVNIQVVDDQHKALVDTINTLYDAMSEGRGGTVLSQIFNNLAEYTTVHFATEEDIMIRFSYPDYEEHASAHSICAAKVSDFKQRFDKGEISMSIELVTFLVNWLHNHLLEMDQKYKAFFKEKGILIL